MFTSLRDIKRAAGLGPLSTAPGWLAEASPACRQRNQNFMKQCVDASVGLMRSYFLAQGRMSLRCPAHHTILWLLLQKPSLFHGPAGSGRSTMQLHLLSWTQ